MKTGINHLFIPGPTNVPERVRQAMNVPMQDMRAPDFGDLTKPLFAGLKNILRTETGTVFMFPGSGTGAWEAAITNTLNPGDKVLMSRFGQFSHLWHEMAERLGLDVHVIDVEWGRGVPVEDYAAVLAADGAHAIKAVFATHNETATGVSSDIEGVRKALDFSGHPAMLFVDGVSAVGSIDFRMDDWGVDLIVTGSQKGLMLPAGLGVLGVSAKALEASKSARMRRAYFEFADMLKLNGDGYFPYTPPTQLFHGLRVSLKMILEEEGLDNVIARHARLAEGVRRGVAAWGLKICAQPGFESDTVTTIMVPEGVDAVKVIRTGYDAYNTSFGSGLARLAGKAFRIGHLGDLNEGMCLTALSVAGMALRDNGAMIDTGAGVAAASEYYREARAGAAAKMAAE
ncbi:aminotransferase class V-fold PLP-dependent enzyme [Rubrimonas cliftonensis]|uniref:Serine-glyoxylate aminotransferase apoenzyme n=1 Tax=Rubrimonas cliftonensis TaxID=89524 RepID=A0A1H3WZV5_9RHOB|nr:aminotransferase class V-fold PLP-dependent enzyme [Rubrimonas cliftonensis]SDZ92510.1 serine-glyoxylate aminotransferase apoenzyme [Rubrimonas cliftonensis]